MLLSILIPTYNRVADLKKNIDMLESFIEKNNYSDRVSILVSDNYSTDNTAGFLSSISSKHHVFIQGENIGLEKNALFVLEKATSEYVMYLGDDDYIDEGYLTGIVNRLQCEKNFSCVIPSFIGIKPTGEVLDNCGRDLGLLSSFYIKGFDASLINSYRGHQLSGLVFRREGLLNAYIENNVGNIYPFIFFVAYSALNGDVWHFPEYPVKVTQPGQEKKDWGYKDDGLISEIFDNYAKLPGITEKQRHQLEMKILTKQTWRFMMYRHRSILAVYKIIRSKKTSLKTKISMFYLYPQQIAIKILRLIKRKVFG